MLENVLPLYDISNTAVIQSFGSGLIHNTWKINDRSKEYILQRINHEVFKEPSFIADNITGIASWLEKNHPGYFFVAPLKTKDAESIVHIPGEGYFRLFPFVEGSLTHDIAQTPQQAFEASKQFGSFTRVLNDFPVENLKITLPDFHNLAYRYSQFEEAVRSGDRSRINECEKTIDYLFAHNDILATYRQITSDKEFKLRVTHHDTKINNVLFDKNEKGICVIDLDTVMPGYFISDVGDMMRTYLSPVSEEEKNFDKIGVRENFFYAIARGYLEEMGKELSQAEIDHFVYSGLFITYMQALRFLTDHLNSDKYYGASYPGHNYIRAMNQVTLLQRLLEKQGELTRMVTRIRLWH
ncbi:MAG TPA: aminoglycoside phosphotransferase family protein [Chitinophagaceae bacterium]|jgi:Ser/Thr protein kinase RdoA (MazF antagonist)|nr:aminoglycoside phosphotransferase family protein [Chitinophagaceae bacterium]